MESLEVRITSLSEKSAAQSLSKEIKLPDWPTTKRATPNSFLRSALFSAIQSKDREFLDDVVLASQQGITIRFTGKQLNQEDLTLWEVLVHLSKLSPLGSVCDFSCYELLKSMELGTGAMDYKRLDDGITRLATSYVNINDKQYFGALILQGSKDKVNNRYILQLNRLLINLYQQNTWIDWDERLLLRKKPLAQYLHGYYSSHKAPHPVKIETLQRFSGSKNKNIPAFKQKLTAAMDELVKIGFFESYKIDMENNVIVKKKQNNA